MQRATSFTWVALFVLIANGANVACDITEPSAPFDEANVDAGAGAMDVDAGNADVDAGHTIADAGVEAEDAGTDVNAPVPPLEIEYLGVAGFLLRVGDDAILTAPFFTNPNLASITVGDVASDPEIIDEYVDAQKLSDVKAIVVGHAHYDHLMDVPYIWTLTQGATIFGNVAVRHLLAAYDPDASCGVTPPFTIPRDVVVAADDPFDDVVDTRNCAGMDACRGVYEAHEGEWLMVPNANVRLKALCSSHPAQFGPVHFGGGCMDEDACTPPANAYDWREGDTLAWLIDFLDDSGRPIHRVFFQDAPADPPVGFVPDDVLEEKRVDAALLCVGTYDQVENHPADIIASMTPRFAIGGHWESFFRTRDQPLQPIPFMDVEPFRTALETAMDAPHNGVVPDPGATFMLAAESGVDEN